MGAAKATVCVPAETPAAERLAAAIGCARAEGLLGKDILGSGFSFDIDMAADVCHNDAVTFPAETLSALTATVLCGAENTPIFFGPSAKVSLVNNQEVNFTAKYLAVLVLNLLALQILKR